MGQKEKLQRTNRPINIKESGRDEYKMLGDRQEEEKVKVKVTQSCLTLCNPMGYTVHGILQARILDWVAIPFCRVTSQLLHVIFPTQGSNPSLLHCKWILYHLSYQ